MPDRGAIIAAVESYCRVQCDKDAQGWASLFTDDVFHEDPVGIHQSRGKDAVTGAFWDHIVRNDVRIWLTDDIIVCGSEALAIMACEVGPSEHRRKISPVVDHFVFADDGRIASVRGFYNLA
jgi:ketosteroid isomerase-like protein